jgi:hypothetical protein
MNFPTNPIEQRLLEVLRGHDVGDVCDRLWGDASDEARAASLRPQPASRFSQSGIAIAGERDE